MVEREGLVAENEMMGTLALSPRSSIKLACMDVDGPIMACTSTFFIKSTAAFTKENLFMLIFQFSYDKIGNFKKENSHLYRGRIRVLAICPNCENALACTLYLWKSH